MQAIQTIGASKVYLLVETIKKINFLFMLYLVVGQPAIYFCYGLGLTTLVSFILHTLVLSRLMQLNLAKLLKMPTFYIFSGGCCFFLSQYITSSAHANALIFIFCFSFLTIISQRIVIRGIIAKLM